MKCEEAQELLEAFHDGELTVETRSTLAAHLKTCAKCNAALAELGALSTAVKSAGAFPVPENLRRNVEKLAGEIARPHAAPTRRVRFALLAASHIGVALAGGLIAFMMFGEQAERTFSQQEVVSAHVRSLMDSRLVQVASSDMHTVRPWFAGKVDFSPDVRDFSAAGFPLVGGRVDYVGAARVAALVYMRNKHVITVFVSPASSAETIEFALPRTTSRNGYTIIEWLNQDLLYRAVSDLNTAELSEFVQALNTKS